LRHRFIAATAVAALLQHRAANGGPLCFQRIWFLDPPPGSTVAPSQSLNDWRAGFAGRGFVANIDVAIAHDCDPLLRSDFNANCQEKLHGVWLSRPHRYFGSRSPSYPLLKQKKVKKLAPGSNPPTATAVLFSDGQWRDEMRALSYMIALVFVLTGPSMAGSADRDLPRVGTFAYCGSPILTPAP